MHGEMEKNRTHFANESSNLRHVKKRSILLANPFDLQYQIFECCAHQTCGSKYEDISTALTFWLKVRWFHKYQYYVTFHDWDILYESYTLGCNRGGS